MAEAWLLQLAQSHAPYAKRATGDGAVFIAHLPCEEAVKVAKNENLHVGWGLPTVTRFGFRVRRLLVFP